VRLVGPGVVRRRRMACAWNARDFQCSRSSRIPGTGHKGPCYRKSPLIGSINSEQIREKRTESGVLSGDVKAAAHQASPVKLDRKASGFERGQVLRLREKP
jgi:hypothetical protein